jgi:poly(3-hydroxybutyrate) depolymerase
MRAADAAAPVLRALTILVVALASAVALAANASAAAPAIGAHDLVRIWKIRYRAHDGLERRAYVIVPRWYGPRDHPRLPLVISPHGRGVAALDNVRLWGNLPAVGRFVVVNPEGQGRKLALYSWGDPGEISDLAKMPRLVHEALPWLRIDGHRIYVFGGSMGGQETLLLLAEHPGLLAGAASFDAPTNLALRYRDFPQLTFGKHLQHLSRIEVGGTPSSDPRGYALRSPIDYARRIAFSGVPLQIWWSTRDRIVVDQAANSGALYQAIERLNPGAPVVQVVGTWAHCAELRPGALALPRALALFGLLPPYRVGLSPA